MANKPPSQTIFKWLRDNLGNRCLAPLTSTDVRALCAAVQLIELYAYDRQQCVLVAFSICVNRMQEHTRELAYHAIAHIMEWSDRADIWHHAGLDPIPNPRKCAFES